MSEVAEDTELNAADHARVMADYIRNGEEAAYELGNRGAIRLDASGNLDPEILDAYWHHGFYVFEGVIDDAELAELRADVERVLARAPMTPDGDVDAEGRPALNTRFDKPAYRFAKPLSDPLGGTQLNNGRHPVKMSSPQAGDDAPQWTVHMLDGNLQLMDSALRLYGHPGLLKAAEAVLGADFVPYTDVTFIKEPGLGPSVAWHQDGTTHWDADDWDVGAHGFNFMAQLFPSTAANCVWVVPGSHRLGKVDIRKLTAESGSERITGAVPMLCGAGDVLMMNRQIVHGSFANSSDHRRVTLNAGFLPRKRVLNVTTRRLNGEMDTYDETRVTERSRIIPLAVDARQQAYPDEPRYRYRPLAEQEDQNRWNEENRETVLWNYNLKDMFV